MAQQTVHDPILALQQEAERHWDGTDPTMAALSRAHPLAPTQFWNPDPFAALVEAVLFQQVSLAAGNSILGRLKAGVGTVEPAAVARRSLEELRGWGISRQKGTYLLDLTGHFLDGRLGPHVWSEADDGDVERRLVGVRGIGPWTAKMFLMFHLQRPDVCAPEDLGLRQSFAMVYGGTDREAWKGLQARSRAWSPYNTVAARVLWKARRDED